MFFQYRFPSGRGRNRFARFFLFPLLLLCGLFPVALAQDEGDPNPESSAAASLDSLRALYESTRSRADSLDTLMSAILSSAELPQFRKLRAAGGISRGVVAGGLVSLELSSPALAADPQVILSGLPGERPEVTAIQGLHVPISDLTDTILTVRMPDSLPRGEYQVQVLVAGKNGAGPDILQRPRVLYVASLFNIIGLSLLPVALLTALLVLFTRRSGNMQGIRGLQLLFLEPENMTYSLSRAQFVLWTAAIAWGYMFLFLARGLVEDIWAFPPLSGFIYTFLISLGTLVGAQATSSVKGVKGAGGVHPSVADLVVHGGVFALERVQQILWTLIAIGIFLTTIVKNYANATAMPEIPEELLILMGISSAGYLAGKAARKAGPVIQQVRTAAATPPGGGDENVVLNIAGEHLSRNAVLRVDGIERPEKPIVIAPDMQEPNEFARELQFRLENMPLAAWLAAPHHLLLVHPDGQRCEWTTTPRIVNVTAGEPDEEGRMTLKIETEYVPREAAIDVTGAVRGPESIVREGAAPNVLNVTVTPANPLGEPFEEIRIPYGANRAATYRWNS